ncbi:MAG: DUF1853 family protein [Bacteroidota bacterium]
MSNASRIASIVNATHLDSSLTGIPTFHLSELELQRLPEFELPNNRRLGHLIERVVAELIKASENFCLLHENIQIVENKTTIGELDFIIQNTNTQKIIHVELAYKFYLYDATLSPNTFECWIGPNRRDALHEKIEKLQQKQFPLLYHKATQAKLPTLDVASITQKLCILTYLFVPYNKTVQLNVDYQKAIKGYYVDFQTFCDIHEDENTYFIPVKKDWGIHPSAQETWLNFNETQKELKRQLQHKHTPLCWKKNQRSYEQFFVTWW